MNCKYCARIAVLVFGLALACGVFWHIFFDKRINDAIELISGVVVAKKIDNGRTVLYLDFNLEYDSDSDGKANNDFDEWVSSNNLEIQESLREYKIGEMLFAKALWKGDESTRKKSLNHFYILELYEL